MALLKFNKGLLANLKETAITEGNVYITTDEKAMYVDIAADKRIRIGQIVEQTSSEWQNLAKPYDASTYYYITDINALVRWNETEQKWVQINSTAALEGRVATLENTVGDSTKGLVKNVADLQTGVNSLNTTVNGTNGVGGLVQKVAALEAASGEPNVIEKVTIGGVEQTITNETLALGALAGKDKVADSDLADSVTEKFTTINTTLGTLATKTELTNAQNTLQGKIDTANQNITAVENLIGDGFAATEGSTITDRVEALEADVSANEASIKSHATRIGQVETAATNAGAAAATAQAAADAAKTAADNAQEAADAAQGTANTAVANAQTAQNAANAAQGTANEAKTKANDNATAIATIQGEITGIKGNYTTKTYVDAEVKKVADNLATTAEDVEKIEGTLTELTGTTIPGINKSISDNATAIGTINTALNSKVDTSTYTAKVAELAEDIETAQTQANKGVEDAATAKAAAVAAQSTADTAVANAAANASAIQTLQGKIGNLTNIMNFRGTVTAKPTGADSGDDNNPYVAGDVVVVIGDGDDAGKEFVFDGTTWHEIGDTSAEGAAISDLQDRMDTAEDDIEALEAALDTANTGIKARLTAAEGDIDELETAVGGMYTNAQIDAMLSWGSF